MILKGYSAFHKALPFLKPHHQIDQCRNQDVRLGAGLPLCRDAVSVFYGAIYYSNYMIRSNRILFKLSKVISKMSNDFNSFFIFKVSRVATTPSSSSCRAANTDIPDPFLPLLPIVHRLRQVFKATSRILI